MQAKEILYLSRNCAATEIPSGKKVELFKGTELWIMQSLGGTFTVATHQGQMVSISGKDADALGKEVPPEAKADPSLDGKTIEEKVKAKLKTCYDPEIPHNILDLGLVYEQKITPIQDNEVKVFIKMTLTAPGCGMGEWLRQDVVSKIKDLPEVKECEVDVVFDPPWDRSMMHPALSRELG